MSQGDSYTTEEIAQILKVSKLTVYDLIKKGELASYRVGRQMRVDAADLEAYKNRAKGSRPGNEQARTIIISGQDISLDILARYLEKEATGCRPLRSYVGSLNSLISMYQGESDIVSTHLFDADTSEYNVPFVRKVLSGFPLVIVNLICRWAGFYVQKGNPKKIETWQDLQRRDICLVNREKGSGARVLLDEQLYLHKINPHRIKGYDIEESNHLAVAGAVAKGTADVGVGIEKAAQIVGVDFIPMMKERYDLVILKTPENTEIIRAVRQILQSESFQNDLHAVGGYDFSQTGRTVFETEI
jgi:putative molybdopterin biosynthesis protein